MNFHVAWNNGQHIFIHFFYLESAVTSYPTDLPLGDASDASVEVQMLLSGEEVIQGVHLGTVTDVYALVTALHDVYHPPGGGT